MAASLHCKYIKVRNITFILPLKALNIIHTSKGKYVWRDHEIYEGRSYEGHHFDTILLKGDQLNVTVLCRKFSNTDSRI